MTGYEKLTELLSGETAAIKQRAYELVIQLGWDHARYATMLDVAGGMEDADRDRVAWLARSIAATDTTAFLAFVQREFESAPIMGDGLPLLSDEQDTICPVCKQDMGDDCWDGSDSEYDSEGGATAWNCPNCGASGRAIYGAPRFLCHDNVIDGEGNPFDVSLH